MEVRKAAVEFIKTLSPEQRNKVKIMLKHGVTVGADYARSCEIDVEFFNANLKSIFWE